MDKNSMLRPFLGEFVGTLVFLLIILVVLAKVANPKWMIAILIGGGLAIGIILCFLFNGPGYLNPAVALMGGISSKKSNAFIISMIVAELLAVGAALLIYYNSPQLRTKPFTFPSAKNNDL